MGHADYEHTSLENFKVKASQMLSKTYRRVKMATKTWEQLSSNIHMHIIMQTLCTKKTFGTRQEVYDIERKRVSHKPDTKKAQNHAEILE